MQKTKKGWLIQVVVILTVLASAGCGEVREIAEISALASAAAGAAALTVVAIHNATERQLQVATEQGRLAAQAIATKHAGRGVKKSRYLAVATVREPDSQGTKSLMIFDTETNQVVSPHVYDVKGEPKSGQTAKFETYSAEYVGTGQY
jgi:hypothetical protein